MSAGWIAASVRARLLLERRAGVERALGVADAHSLREALTALGGTLFAPGAVGVTLEEAQRAIAATAALQLRVLAAWVPPGGTVGLRSLGAWFELANIEDRLAYFAGGDLRPPFELGVLSTIWETAGSTQSVGELRRALASSSWGDPGSDDPQEILLALRLAWARRVAAQAPEAQTWVAGAVAILLAEELLVGGFRTGSVLMRHAELAVGPGAKSVADVRAQLPGRSAWALEGVDDPSELWRAELRWWRRVEAGAERMIHGRLDSREVVVGAIALLALDALRMATALAVVGGGNADPAREVLDALC